MHFAVTNLIAVLTLLVTSMPLSVAPGTGTTGGMTCFGTAASLLRSNAAAGWYAGLHYNWHRYYDPNIGRYLTPDPLGLAGGLNLYAYADNDPVNHIDRNGLYTSLHTKEGMAMMLMLGLSTPASVSTMKATVVACGAIAATAYMLPPNGPELGPQLLEAYHRVKNSIRDYFRQRVLCDTVDTNGDGIPDAYYCGGVVHHVPGKQLTSLASTTTPRFGANDLVYGPSARGALRQLQQSAGGRLLTDVGGPAVGQSWVQFSIQTLQRQLAAGGRIHFDLTHMKDISGVLQGTGEFGRTVTAAELRFLQQNWSQFKNSTTFYKNGVEVGVPW